MQDHKLGVGLVGAGAIAQLHARVLEASGQATLIGVYDAAEGAARDLAGRFGAKAYPRLSDLFEDSAVDAIAVLTPSGAREPVVCQAAAAGKHVICEKPVEIMLDRIDRMIEACRSRGVQLACVLNNRYNPVYSRIHECVQSGKLGRMILGDVSVKWYREPAYYQNSPWRGTWTLDGGGALMNQSIHFVDLLLWIMGPVRDVSAYAAANLHTYIEVEDMAVASLCFENGALGSIVGTTAAFPGLYDRLSFHGTRGSILVESGRIVRWEVPDDPLDSAALDALNRVQMGNAHTPMALDIVPHQRQLEEIFACLKSGKPVAVDGAEARKAVALVLEIYRSAGRYLDCNMKEMRSSH